jgi:hypothetical protein
MGRSASKHRLGYSILLICAFAFLLIPALQFHAMVYQVADFKTVYSSSKCLIDQCDPYDSAALLKEYVKGGGDVSPKSELSAFLPFQALYPPSSLFWVTPFALLPWSAALAVWSVVSGTLFVTAVFLIADICRQWTSEVPIILLGLFLATSTLLLTTAQPSSVAISLCAIGVWSLVRNRFIGLGVFCFALSLALKPQIGGLIVIYFLLAGGQYWRRSVAILATAAILCLPGILWAAHNPAASNWPQELKANIAGGSTRGSMNDPGPSSYNSHLVTDLQSVIAVLDDDPPIYNRISWGIVGSMILIWAFVARRSKPSLKKDLLGVAAIACLGLLPIYHRHYDVRLLVVTFPAVGILMAEGGLIRLLAVLPPFAAIACSHPTFIRDHLHLHQESLGPIKTVLLLRLSPLALLFSGIFYLVLFVRTLDIYRDRAVKVQEQ